MIKVLHILSSLNGGGVESLLYSYYKNMDRCKFHFDFAVFSKDNNGMEKLFIDLGCNVYHLTPKREGFCKSIYDLNRVIKENKYDIVHSHQNMCSIFAMFLALKNGVKVRIAHSHYAQIPNAQFLERSSTRKVLRPILKLVSTNWFACSNEAAIALWGRDAVKMKKTTILYNAINLEKFMPNSEIRNSFRERYGLENSFVVGCVARLNQQKNIKFLLEIFKEIKKERSNSKLILIGDGEEKEDIKTKINYMGMQKDVLLLGNRTDVSDLIKMFDVFVLPSLFEGLGIVYIESQAAGVMTFASDCVPKETNLTSLMNYIPLDYTAEKWASIINNKYNNFVGIDNDVNIGILQKAHYDIKLESRRLENIYYNLVERKHHEF